MLPLLAFLLFQGPLFDGQSLNGWQTFSKPEDKDKAFWSVRDGAITCDSLGRKDHDYVWLVNTKEFSDFDLEFQVRGFRHSTGNSGLQFRSRYDPQAGWMNGPQVDIHPPAPFRTGLIYDETFETRRWIFPSLKNWEIAPEQGPRKYAWRYSDEGEGWNDIRLTCRGTKVTTVVNGIVITDLDLGSVLDDEAHRRHNVGRGGHFALQLHSRDELLIQYRRFRIKPLP